MASSETGKTIRIRAKIGEGDTTEVKTKITHPMRNQATDADTGETTPADFVQEVIAEHNDVTILTAQLGVGVSENPLIAFKFRGGKSGDKIRISWTDNQGRNDSQEATIT